MEYPLNITALNDYIFCPASIYFHMLYGNMDKSLYQDRTQINGTYIHEKVDNAGYSTSTNILQGVDVYCEKYNLVGKIDIFDIQSGILTERKKKVINIYDGYIFQLYGQYFSLVEMGYDVKKLRIHSYDDNKNYEVELPQNNEVMLDRFEKTINEIETFNIETFTQTNKLKCENCIYEPYCDRSLK